MKKDIVCNMDVKDDTKYTTLHAGQKLYFCSNECRQDFIRQPEKYVDVDTMKEQRKAA